MMSTSQLKTRKFLASSGYGIWLKRFLLLTGFGIIQIILAFYAYCFGLWGRNSLFLQYLFQCDCPAVSEEWRYPNRVDIIAPACSYVGSILSQTGNLLYVWEGESRFADTFSSTYLLDFRTDEKIPFFIGRAFSKTSFLTDGLLFLSLEYGHDEYKGGDYILDRTTGKQYPIQSFISLRKDALHANGDLNLEVLAMELGDTQDVYLIDNETIVALKSDLRTSPERSFYIHQTSLPRYDPEGAKKFLQENCIAYHAISGLFQEETVSPDRKFIARGDGIYLAASGEKIVESYTVRGINGKYFSVQGWTSDSSGVIYYKFLDGCLLELPSYDAGTCSISVPQPLIKLKVPEEYLSSTQTR